MRQKINGKLILICALVGAFLGLWIVTAGIYLNRVGIRLEPLETDGSGHVLPGSGFHLSISGDPEPDELRERIETDPPISLEITPLEEKGRYLLTPLKPLEGGSEIIFRIDGREFIFQVANQLLILSHFPADGGENVPVESGIEFEFNTQDISLEEFEQHLVISPPVEGRTSRGDGRFVFYPVPGYEYETEYHVTLLAGLESKTGAVLAGDYSFAFTTISEELEANSWRFQIAGSAATRNTLTSEITGIQIYLDQEIVDAGEEVHVTLHSFESGEQYLEGMTDHITRTTRQQPDVQIRTDEMEEYASFSIQPIPLGENSGGSSARWLLEFPEELPEGWYAATYRVTVPARLTPNGEELELERQMFLQISDISVFYMFYDTSMVLWVNDAATGQPIENAEMQVSGAYHASGTTGADGVMTIDNAQILEESYDQSGGVFTITAGDRLFVDSSYYYNNSYYNSSNPAHHYMSYLFTDRPLYMTSDTIQVWGMVRPRYEDTPPPENLTLNFAEGMAEQDITLNGDGTFTATLTFENMAASYWSSLSLRMGETDLTSQYLRVEDYVKPVYTASTETDQVVYMLGHDDPPVITFDVSTFDGTPAARFSAKVSGTDSLRLPSEELFTDEQGNITVEAPITSSENSWYPRSHYYYWRNEDAEQENFYLYGDVYAIHRDVMLLGRPENGSDGMDLHVSTHSIDASGVTETHQLWDWDTIRGGAVSQEVTAALKHVYWTKEPSGTTYDYINRTTVQLYRYEQHDDLVQTFTFTTQNGAYTLSGLPRSSREDGTYYVELNTRDSLGRAVRSTSYLGPRYDRYGNSGTHQYVLDKVLTDDDLQAEPTNDGYEYPYYSSVRSRFTDNENVTFVLMDNNEEVTDFSGRILYGVAQDGFSRINQTGSGSFTLPFGEDLLPNYVITGAYFDGKHIFALQDKYMNFNSEQRKLDIALTTDKESYRPGDEMTVTAQVNNDYTGAPASNTQVVLAVVDEAIFAIQEQYVTILSDMYRSVYYPYITKYASYNQSDIGGAGEKGGGGGEEPIRTDFEDTAFFSTATTDSGGAATFTMKLPDNITSWRLTSLALSPENHAGNAKINRPATQEFFLLPVVNDTILTGDSFSVGLRGSGRGVSSRDSTSYQVTVEGNGVNETKEVSSPLRTYAALTFDGLATGEYTVTIRGQCGSYSDAIQLPFTVKPSGIEVALVKSFRLSEGIDVDPLRYPVCIHFYDKTYQNYNRVLRNVNWLGRTGVRADQRLGRRYAADQFEQQGISWYANTTEEESITDINGGSLLSLFPYSNEDLELSALAHLAVPDLVGKGGLSGWTFSGLDGTDGAVGAIYLAQAISGEEFSEDPGQLLGAGDLDYVDRIYIAMAMAMSGDTQGANQAYDQLVTPNLKELTGISGDKAVYVAPGDNDRSDKDCTAAALLLAVLLEKDEAHELVRYLVEKRSRYEPYILEQLYYLTNFEAAASSPAEFSYQMNGQTVSETLDSHYKYVSFTKTQLAGASFKELSGEVYADVFYAGDPADVADQSQKLIGFTKTMTVMGGGEPTVGSVVKFTLTPDFSGLDINLGSSQLVIDDYIPTGMRFERYDSNEFRSDGRGWFLQRRQGQSIQFIAWGSNPALTRKPIVYYARCAAPGDYVVESAYINSGNSDIWGSTEREQVTIR